LNIVNEEDNMDSSFTSLDQFEESGVCGRRGINGICGYPEVVFAVVDHLPDCLEKLVTVDNEIFVGKKFDLLESP
jgi:hypothetical protein